MDSWNTLSLKDRADIIKVAIKNGMTKLSDIRDKYNEFALGGGLENENLYGGGGYVYDLLPGLFAQDGVNITVYSGKRPGAKTVTGKTSRHALGQAADIGPTKGSTFADIRRVLDDPNSNVSRWLVANGYGYLDETSATGTTKYWHDHNRDHSHYHIGTDSGLVARYSKMMGGRPQGQASSNRVVGNPLWTQNAERMWAQAQPMYQELLKAGLSHAEAAGILGNIALESSFDPNASNSKNGGHWGYLQNDSNITPWVKANYGGYGHQNQMNYLIAGLQGRLPKANMGLADRFNGYRSAMRGVTDPQQAAYLWEQHYEKSDNEAIPQRKYYAQYFYDKMLGNTPKSASYVPEIPEGYLFPDEIAAMQGSSSQFSSPQVIINLPQSYPDFGTSYPLNELNESTAKAAEKYYQAQLEREQKQQGINNFFTVMNLMNSGSSSSQTDNSFLGPIASLANASTDSGALGLVGNMFALGGDEDGEELTRVRRANGEYAFVKTKDGHAVTDGTGRYPLYDASGKNIISYGVGDSFPYTGTGLNFDVDEERISRYLGEYGEPVVTPQGMVAPEKYDPDALFKAAQEHQRQEEIARNRAIDAKVSQYAFTPEGFFGQALQPTNLLSPVNTGRGIYNWASGEGYGDMRDLFLPNSGVFSEEFAKEHPYLTMAGNLATDALALGTGAALWKMPKYRAALQAENRAAQEAVANSWDGIINSGRRAPIVEGSHKTSPGSMLLYERPTSGLSSRERLGMPKGTKIYTPEENQQFLNQINDFAGKYGYQGLEDGTYTAKELESYARALLDKHNSYYRGVTMPIGEDLEKVYNILGKDATEDEILKYVATHPKDNEGWLFLSPRTNAAIYGKTARVSRPYNLGADRTKWFEEGDFPMVMKKPNMSWEEFRQYQGMADPWAKMRYDYHGNPVLDETVPNEVVSSNQPMIFREWSDVEMPLSNKTATTEYTRPIETTAPKITAENAASITPEQWTAAQDAAIAKGDWEEAQRLKDLYDDVSGRHVTGYHGQLSDAAQRAQGYNPYSSTRHSRNHEGLFASSSEDVGNTYKFRDDSRLLNVNIFSENPYITDAEGRSWRAAEIYSPPGYPGVKQGLSTDKVVEKAKAAGHDGVIIKNVVDVGPARAKLNGASEVADDYVGFTGRVKLKDAVTYDDNGQRIALGDRNNFSVDDMRYSWLPWLLGTGTAGTLYGVFQSDNNIR